METLLEKLERIGNPEFRAAAAYSFARKVRDFAGELAMQTTARGEPEAEIIANNPRAKAALKAALTALGALGKALLDSERSIDIAPHVAGLLRAEAQEAGHLNKLLEQIEWKGTVDSWGPWS